MNANLDDRIVNNGNSVTKIRNSSEKILLVEEDERSINDGLWAGGVDIPGFYFVIGPDLLSIRHDRKRVMPDRLLLPWGSPGQKMPNGERKGNVLCCDGHADYITRNQAHTARAVIARYR